MGYIYQEEKLFLGISQKSVRVEEKERSVGWR